MLGKGKRIKIDFISSNLNYPGESFAGSCLPAEPFIILLCTHNLLHFFLTSSTVPLFPAAIHIMNIRSLHNPSAICTFIINLCKNFLVHLICYNAKHKKKWIVTKLQRTLHMDYIKKVLTVYRCYSRNDGKEIPIRSSGSC